MKTSWTTRYSIILIIFTREQPSNWVIRSNITCNDDTIHLYIQCSALCVIYIPSHVNIAVFSIASIFIQKYKNLSAKNWWIEHSYRKSKWKMFHYTEIIFLLHCFLFPVINCFWHLDAIVLRDCHSREIIIQMWIWQFLLWRPGGVKIYYFSIVEK